MLLSLRFLDKESWSFHATLTTIIPLVLFYIFRQTLNTQSLVLMSLLSMMQGTLLAKILVTGFLCFVVFEPTEEWIYRSLLYVISTCIIHMIPTNNPVHSFVMRHNYIQYVLIAIIIVWMIYILKPVGEFGISTVKNIVNNIKNI